MLTFLVSGERLLHASDGALDQRSLSGHLEARRVGASAGS